MIVSGRWNNIVVVTGMATTTTQEAIVIMGRTALAITEMSVIMVVTTITTTPMIAVMSIMSTVMEETTGAKDRTEMITIVKLNRKRTALMSLFRRKSLALPAVEDINLLPRGGPLLLGLVRTMLAL